MYTSLWCRNLKLPSRRPSVVCENCLYSLDRDMRARAFHILEPKGTVDMLILFLEERSDGAPPLLDSYRVSLTESLRYAQLSFFVCISTADSITEFLLWQFYPFLTAAGQYLMSMFLMTFFIRFRMRRVGLYLFLVNGKVIPSQNEVVCMDLQLLMLILLCCTIWMTMANLCRYFTT